MIMASTIFQPIKDATHSLYVDGIYLTIKIGIPNDATEREVARNAFIHI